jgi:hypothetical protein
METDNMFDLIEALADALKIPATGRKELFAYLKTFDLIEALTDALEIPANGREDLFAYHETLWGVKRGDSDDVYDSDDSDDVYKSADDVLEQVKMLIEVITVVLSRHKAEKGSRKRRRRGEKHSRLTSRRKIVQEHDHGRAGSIIVQDHHNAPEALEASLRRSVRISKLRKHAKQQRLE